MQNSNRYRQHRYCVKKNKKCLLALYAFTYSSSFCYVNKLQPTLGLLSVHCQKSRTIPRSTRDNPLAYVNFLQSIQPVSRLGLDQIMVNKIFFYLHWPWIRLPATRWLSFILHRHRSFKFDAYLTGFPDATVCCELLLLPRDAMQSAVKIACRLSVCPSVCDVQVP